MVMGGAHVQCVLTCAAAGAKQMETKKFRRRRRLLGLAPSTSAATDADKLAMSNNCISGCAHNGMFVWPGMHHMGPAHIQMDGTLGQGAIHPFMHPLGAHAAFGMYGPPTPNILIQEKEEKVHHQMQAKQHTKDKLNIAFQLKKVSAQQKYPSTNLNHASVIATSGIYTSAAPITSCVMQCMGMGLAAMKDASAKKKLRRRRLLGFVPSKKTSFSDRLQMSYSCMAGCNHGSPFMFNWTNPLYPGNLNAWALTHQGSVALLPTQVSTTPLDGTSCVMQCLAMGGESMMEWDRGIKDSK
tara:strand:- start:279 stop:1172 length:894 start_codon:yes stop_codon:yes gene_type:complete